MSAYAAAEAVYLAANAAADEVYNAGRSRAYSDYAAAFTDGAYAAADAAGRYAIYIAAYAVLDDSVEDAEIAHAATLDANYSIYLGAIGTGYPAWESQ